MERLTEKHWRNLDPWECCGQDNYCKRGCHEAGGCNNGCKVPINYRKLAAYEDTGLTPEQIQALTADKDEQAGRIMELDNGLKKLRTSFQWLSETIRDLDYKAWAEDKIDAINALLGGAEDGK